eukprot:TRINITY_DN110358_c0_g1_i1.p1 TRINITY_DN110358_c0_g1~~TRINITY_DN110358_c0_g1_i1.p1  ORF type:complete len:416 (-),score=103.48 TRINITY_DN110358_c0_g1_i1:59-1306(-)
MRSGSLPPPGRRRTSGCIGAAAGCAAAAVAAARSRPSSASSSRQQSPSSIQPCGSARLLRPGSAVDPRGITGSAYPAYNMCRPDSADALRGSGSARELGGSAAELALLRARFDLRLDVERVRTQGAAEELRTACGEALRTEQAAASRQVTALHSRFERAEALQRESEALALQHARAELDEVRASNSTQNDLLRRESAEREASLQAQLREARVGEAFFEAEAVQARRDTQSVEEELVCELEAVQEACNQRREQQVAEVLARLTGEHFRLTNEVATAVQHRLSADEEVEQMGQELDGLRCSLAEKETAEKRKQSEHILHEEAAAALCKQAKLWSPTRETLALRLADMEAQMLSKMGSEASRLDAVEEKLRRALAMKNDVIDELKEELLRRESEIVQAHRILAGLHAQHSSSDKPLAQ